MKQTYNPDTLPAPGGFSHVAVSSRPKTVYISGQVAYDTSGTVVGEGDLSAQTTQVYTNIENALKACGATWDDVIKTTLFVCDLSLDKAMIIRDARASFLADEGRPASTMVGVQSLARPELLLEVEAIAMLD